MMINNSHYLQRAATFLLLCAAGIGLFLSIDPTHSGFGSASIAPIKYTPYWLSYLAIPLFLISRKYEWNRLLLAFLVFTTIMIAGSWYAFLIFHRPLEETYLGRALGGGVCVAYFLLACNHRELQYFMPRFGRIILLVAFFMFVRLSLFRLDIWRSGLTQMYHADVIILTSSFILASLFIRQKLLRRAMQMIFATATLLEGKTTAFLSLALTATYLGVMKLHIWYLGGADKAAKFRKSLMSIFAFPAVLTAAVGIMILVITSRLEQADKVRAFTSALRIRQFVDSPFVGSLFTTSPLVTMSYLHIPSHSDLIDLLAFGGALTAVFFFIPLIVVIFKDAKHIIDPNTKKVYLLSKFIIINNLLIMSVNPILSEPRLSFLFWGAIGVLLALLNPPRLLMNSGREK